MNEYFPIIYIYVHVMPPTLLILFPFFYLIINIKHFTVTYNTHCFFWVGEIISLSLVLFIDQKQHQLEKKSVHFPSLSPIIQSIDFHHKHRHTFACCIYHVQHLDFLSSVVHLSHLFHWSCQIRQRFISCWIVITVR